MIYSSFIPYLQVLGAMFRSIPEESTKVKSLLGGTLMAYQVPPPAPIQPISAQEEREEEMRAKEAAAAAAKMTTTKNASLGDIQRRTANNNNNNNYLRQEQKELRESEDTSQSPFSNHFSQTASENEDGRAMTVNGDASQQRHNHVNDGTTTEGGIDTSSQGHISTEGNALDMTNIADTSTSQVDVGLCNGDTQIPGSFQLTSVSPEPELSDDNDEAGPQSGFVVAVHRKILRMDVYFLSSQKSRPSLFGTPLLLPFYETTSQQDLYASVWTQIARLVSPLPPSEASSPSNHALDCDDSLGYEYPFVLKRVKKDGYTCSICPW